MTTFDPEGHFGKDSSIFGLPNDMKSSLTLLPSPWEPTTSFKKGCVRGPEALFKASKQMDLYHPYFKKVYENGVKWLSETEDFIKNLNDKASPLCDKIQLKLDNSQEVSKTELEQVNQLSEEFNEYIYKMSLEALKDKNSVGLIGGDHSCPFGFIKALSEVTKEPFSIVHIDAHFDFRDSYQGFEHSHASIMHNVVKRLDKSPKIFQIGIRDFSESEFRFACEHSTFLLDQELNKKKASGQSFKAILDELFIDLNEKIYISFDIDGLSPEFCPNTGTPVPGGLSFSEAQFMIEHLHAKGHELIGFDLVEVSPSPEKNEGSTLGEGLDEVTAVRLLYSLCCFALASR
jgi:agmatinase